MDLGKAGEKEAGPESAKSQCGSAKERFLPQPEDGKAQPHRTLLYGNAGKPGRLIQAKDRAV